jgi:hypothetical protein
MGPVIETVEAGHVMVRKDERSVYRCKLDGELWPCGAILGAKVAQLDYAQKLADEERRRKLNESLAARVSPRGRGRYTLG